MRSQTKPIMELNSNEIVQFDVGGRLFKTSRSLIDTHEGTMLARLVSDTWQEDPTKPVFIDRDGDMFAQVLNYLRYGSISLPITVSKDMFLRDLDFYGILPVEGSVKTASEAWAIEVDNRHKEIDTLEAEKKDLEAKRLCLVLKDDIDLLANYCASEYIRKIYKVYIYNPETSKQQMEDQERLWNAAVQVYRNGESNETFQKSLSKFGLRLQEINDYHQYYYDLKISLL